MSSDCQVCLDMRCETIAHRNHIAHSFPPSLLGVDIYYIGIVCWCCCLMMKTGAQQRPSWIDVDNGAGSKMSGYLSRLASMTSSWCVELFSRLR